MNNKPARREFRLPVLFPLLPALLYFPLLAAGAEPGASAARMDWDSGEVCFPLSVGEPPQWFDVCLRLTHAGGPVAFELASAVPRQEALPGMATYRQGEGLVIPVARLSDGRVFADVEMDVFYDPRRSGTPYTMEVTAARALRASADQSVARQWNEALLEGIRHDFARPTVHARNLFHTALAMYDAWAAYDDTAVPYLLGRTRHGFACPFNGPPPSGDVRADRETALSYAAYRILRRRFAASPGADQVLRQFRDQFIALGHDPSYTAADYASGGAAALGNHIAACVLDYGLQDGANEAGGYSPRFYQPVNASMAPALAGSQDIADPNRWQPLSFGVFRDQSGNLFFDNTPDFVGPEWGQVYPFALREEDLAVYRRDGQDYRVYHDPGPPPRLDPDDPFGAESMRYKWTFSLVALWSAHLDPEATRMIDISPASNGNNMAYPQSPAQYDQFYDYLDGGDGSRGRTLNPVTGEPYAEQRVPLGDYARVLAEFWADGPDSETPPGHWFTILNHVSDDPRFEKRFRGEAPLDALEWDVKAYFALGGAMHDAAVTAWGIKGYYDYVRPISAIRYMADRGQSSDPDELSYDPLGLPLVPGGIAVVREGDPLAGQDGEHVGEIKLMAWKGPDYVADPETDHAGVGWILARRWWPYQRPTFVSPPFAGYISGHSTFSRAAAEVMTLLTGSEYFPGGLGEFPAPRNDFLVFERGPEVELTLQWATYRDASDQTSLSRIWGGIHPPADDIPGRIIGIEVGQDAFAEAEAYFKGEVP